MQGTNMYGLGKCTEHAKIKGKKEKKSKSKSIDNYNIVYINSYSFPLLIVKFAFPCLNILTTTFISCLSRSYLMLLEEWVLAMAKEESDLQKELLLVTIFDLNFLVDVTIKMNKIRQKMKCATSLGKIVDLIKALETNKKDLLSSSIFKNLITLTQDRESNGCLTEQLCEVFDGTSFVFSASTTMHLCSHEVAMVLESQLNWSRLVLNHLHKTLTNSKSSLSESGKNQRVFNGCSPILDVVVFERIPDIRPKLRSQYSLPLEKYCTKRETVWDLKHLTADKMLPCHVCQPTPTLLLMPPPVVMPPPVSQLPPAPLLMPPPVVMPAQVEMPPPVKNEVQCAFAQKEIGFLGYYRRSERSSTF